MKISSYKNIISIMCMNIYFSENAACMVYWTVVWDAGMVRSVATDVKCFFIYYL